MPKVRTIVISGEKLAQLRDGKFVSQERFGASVGLTSGRVSVLERKKAVKVRPQTFLKMAAFFGMTPEEFQQRLKPEPLSASTELEITISDDSGRSEKLPREWVEMLQRRANEAGKDIVDFITDFFEAKELRSKTDEPGATGFGARVSPPKKNGRGRHKKST